MVAKAPACRRRQAVRAPKPALKKHSKIRKGRAARGSHARCRLAKDGQVRILHRSIANRHLAWLPRIALPFLIFLFFFKAGLGARAA